MSIRFNNALRTTIANSIVDLYDGGVIEVYTGTQPASAEDAASGTLLVSVDLPTPAFAGAVDGEASKDGSWSGIAIATGDAGWFRMKDSAGIQWIDGAITADGGVGEITLSSIAIAVGETIVVNTSVLTQPSE